MTQHEEIEPRYPLGEWQVEGIRSRTGKPLTDITLEAIRRGQVQPDDLTIHADTLRKQARISEAAGYRQLAANLRRAAELTDVPNERLLSIYDALRPWRSTFQDLMDLAAQLESAYQAKETADYIRQSAAAYRGAGLLRSEGE